MDNNFDRDLVKVLPRLRKYARKLLRHDPAAQEDLVQRACVRALSKRHLYREQDTGGGFTSWVLMLMHNDNINRVRKQGREPDTVPDAVGEIFLSKLHSSDNAERGVWLRELSGAIDRLNPDQREVLLMVGVNGASYAEAVAAIGCPFGTVRSRLSRGRDELRRLIGGQL